jgi:NADH-quinone oxidoreductase subunit L
MVTAGVYMVARSNPIFNRAPDARMAVAIIGTLTAIFAASIGMVQTDIKKVLAYSTISQLGYMFLACGVGAFVAGMFHVLTHAFFKACLFLGSGSVIHAMGGEQDMRRMGGLKSRLPITYWTFLIATLAIAGIPPLAGFFSKDAILTGVFEDQKYLLFAIGLVTAGLTAFYMFRLVSLTFEGRFRGTHEQEHHLHESPPSMTAPLVILAVLSTIGGLVGLPKIFGEKANVIERFLEPIFLRVAWGSTVEHPLEHTTEWLLIGASIVIASGGAYLGWLWYAKQGGRIPARLAAAYPALHELIEDKFDVDEAYDFLFVRPFDWLARMLWKVVDVLIIDGILNAGAFLVELTGDLLRFLQTGNVRNYALTFFLGVVGLLLIVIGFGF